MSKSKDSDSEVKQGLATIFVWILIVAVAIVPLVGLIGVIVDGQPLW